MYVPGRFFYVKENQGIFTNDEKTPWSKEQWMILVIFVIQKTPYNKNLYIFCGLAGLRSFIYGSILIVI